MIDMDEAEINRKSNEGFAVQGGMNSGPVSAKPYMCEEFFALEKENIFRRAWLFMGHASLISGRGDFILRDIEVCDASILITRG